MIKVLLSKLGLDVHSRGVLTVAKILRDSGMDVIYLGNATADQIINAAVQEDADIIGASSLGGAHLDLGKEMIRLASEKGIKDNKGFVIGGAIPHEDVIELKDIGFDDVFTSGATKDEIVSSIKDIVKGKVKS